MDMLNIIDGAIEDLISNQKFLHDYDAAKNIEERLGHVETLLKHKEMVKRHEKIIELAKNEKCSEDFERVYKEKWAEAQKDKMNVRNTKEFKSYKERILAISQTEPRWDLYGNDIDKSDDPSKNDSVADVQVTEEAFTIIDPWTKSILSYPVRNIKCGHNYERDATMELLEKGSSLKCPVNGCANELVIEKDHLIYNENLRRRIEIHLTKLGVPTSPNKNPYYDD